MVLLLLPQDEVGVPALLVAAEGLARRLGSSVRVLKVGPCAGGSETAGAWRLEAEDPLPAIRGFIRRSRPRRVVLGLRGWERWGRNLVNCSR